MSKRPLSPAATAGTASPRHVRPQPAASPAPVSALEDLLRRQGGYVSLGQMLTTAEALSLRTLNTRLNASATKVLERRPPTATVGDQALIDVDTRIATQGAAARDRVDEYLAAREVQVRSAQGLAALTTILAIDPVTAEATGVELPTVQVVDLELPAKDLLHVRGAFTSLLRARGPLLPRVHTLRLCVRHELRNVQVNELVVAALLDALQPGPVGGPACWWDRLQRVELTLAVPTPCALTLGPLWSALLTAAVHGPLRHLKLHLTVPGGALATWQAADAQWAALVAAAGPAPWDTLEWRLLDNFADPEPRDSNMFPATCAALVEWGTQQAQTLVLPMTVMDQVDLVNRVTAGRGLPRLRMLDAGFYEFNPEAVAVFLERGRALFPGLVQCPWVQDAMPVLPTATQLAFWEQVGPWLGHINQVDLDYFLAPPEVVAAAVDRGVLASTGTLKLNATDAANPVTAAALAAMQAGGVTQLTVLEVEFHARDPQLATTCAAVVDPCSPRLEVLRASLTVPVMPLFCQAGDPTLQYHDGEQYVSWDTIVAPLRTFLASIVRLGRTRARRVRHLTLHVESYRLDVLAHLFLMEVLQAPGAFPRLESVYFTSRQPTFERYSVPVQPLPGVQLAAAFAQAQQQGSLPATLEFEDPVREALATGPVMLQSAIFWKIPSMRR